MQMTGSHDPYLYITLQYMKIATFVMLSQQDRQSRYARERTRKAFTGAISIV
jgi:hypothetical protein